MEFRALVRHAVLAMAVLLVGGGSALADEVLDRAQQLIRAGKAQAAFELLAPLEDQRAGEPQFDYLLGVAAVDSGKPALGVFALERVVDQQPNNVDARAELARAYFALGERETARQEFGRVKELGVSDSVQRTIDKYLSAIESQFDSAQAHTRGYLSAAAGYDSNTSAATDARTFTAPGLLPGFTFGLGPNAREKKSQFLGLSGGVSHTQPLRADLNAFGGLDMDLRSNVHAHEFDPMTVNANLGLHWLRGQNQYRGVVQGQVYDIDSELERRLLGATLQMQRTLDRSNQVTVFGQAALIDYAGQPRDVIQYTAGAAWGRALGGKGSPIVFFSGYAGTENGRSGTLEQETRAAFFGVRVAGQYALNGQTNLFGGIGYEHSNYGAVNTAFLEKRSDNLWDVNLGLEYVPARHWTVRPQFRYTKNNSSLVLNDYDRSQVYVSVRRDFE